jgi:hypothetical protein
MNLICTNCEKETIHRINELCLDCYFEKNAPTKTTNRSWIYQLSPPSFDKKGTEQLFDSGLAQLLINGHYDLDDEKKQLTLGDYVFPYSLAGLDEMALKSGIIVGKWLIYRSEDTIDNVWKQIALAVMKRRLGRSAKVSTARQRGKSFVICVYTENYLTEEDVKRVRSELLNLGIEEPLCYKPDLYTYLNIYSGTSSIKPCRYRM